MVTNTDPGEHVSDARIDDRGATSGLSLVRRGPVILATGGTGTSDAPAIVARLIAERLERPLWVVSVIDPPLIDSGPPEIAPIIAPSEPERRAMREELVRRYLLRALPRDSKWKLDLRYGSPAWAIGEASRESEACLVVVGSAPHGRRGRTRSGGRAAQILRQARCPVLSVAPELVSLPRNAVVAIDFSPSSICAALDALRLLGDTGTLTLIHVSPVVHPDQSHDPSGGVFGGDIDKRLSALRAKLLASGPTGISIEMRGISGEVTEEVLHYAKEVGADLVVVGTHGPNLVERIFLGSVATSLLHLADCSVLAATRPTLAESVEVDLEVSGTGWTTDATAWRQILDIFTTRNVTRRVRIEVDDPSFGAQVQARGYVLSGTTYDERDRRVLIMLSAPDASMGHLTRSIADVSQITVMRGTNRRDVALEVRHGTGETLLVFED